MLCFMGELALDIRSVGRNENGDDSHYHGNMNKNTNLLLGE